MNPTAIPELVPQAYTVLSIAGVALGVVGLLVAAAATRRAGRLEAHYRALMTGVDGTDVAAALEAYVRRLEAAEQRVAHLEAHTAGLDDIAARLATAESGLLGLQARAADIDTRLRKAVQRVRVLRYGAFADVGGDQSFALAMLDDHGDGVVLSGLHHRNGVRVYAKPLADRRSSYALTTEEAQAVAEAAGAPPGG